MEQNTEDDEGEKMERNVTFCGEEGNEDEMEYLKEEKRQKTQIMTKVER